MTYRTACLFSLLLSSCRLNTPQGEPKNPQAERGGGTDRVPEPRVSADRRVKVRVMPDAASAPPSDALFAASPPNHRQEMASLWQRLPQSNRHDFFAVLKNSWAPASHLGLMQFAVRAFATGSDIKRDIALLAESIPSPATQEKVAAFLGTRHDIVPKDAIALLMAIEPSENVSADDISKALALPPSLVAERLCLLAFKNGVDVALYRSNTLCRLPYAMLKQDHDLLEQLYADAALFASVVNSLENVPLPQRSWWSTTADDRKDVKAFFAKTSSSEWQSIEHEATALLPHVRSGDKAATLAVLAEVPAARAVVAQVVEKLDSLSEYMQRTKTSCLLRAFARVAAPLREAAFSHAIATHQELNARLKDKEGQRIDFDMDMAVELFGAFGDTAGMDAMQAVLAKLIFGNHSALNAAHDTHFLIMSLLHIRQEVRLTAATTALELYEYESSHAQAKWGVASQPYTLGNISGRMASIEQGIAEGRMPHIWSLLRDLERVGCTILRMPLELGDEIGNSMTNLLFMLSSTSTERYAELRDGAAMLASPVAEANLAHLIVLGKCRQVSPLALAHSAFPILRALQAREPDRPADVASQTQLLRSLCKTHRGQALSARVDRAVAQIEQGTAVDWVRQHLDEPLRR